MVLKKSEYDEKCQNSLTNSWNSIQTIIDKRLLANNKTFHTKDLPSEFREELLKLILEKYKSAGWKIQRINGYDQRENDSWDYLQFS